MKVDDTLEGAETWNCLQFLDDGASMTADQLVQAVKLKPNGQDDNMISQFGEGLKMASYYLNSGKGVSVTRQSTLHMRSAGS